MSNSQLISILAQHMIDKQYFMQPHPTLDTSTIHWYILDTIYIYTYILVIILYLSKSYIYESILEKSWYCKMFFIKYTHYPSLSYSNITLWLFNIAMEHGPLPLKHGPWAVAKSLVAVCASELLAKQTGITASFSKKFMVKMVQWSANMILF